jgi:hypothetical protein
MNSNPRSTLLAAFVVAALVGAGWLGHEAWERRAVAVSGSGSGVPVVMRSPGGLLEIATVTVHERFKRTDTKEFWGLPLGTTVSIIQVPVTYRFHIQMEREWPILLQGKTAIVRTGEVQPSLPVAIDTGRMEKYSQNGWARFNKDENLATLEQSITRDLELRARDPATRQLALDAGRKTVREFVTTWLLKEQGWKQDAEHRVVVLFPGETLPPRGVSPD